MTKKKLNNLILFVLFALPLIIVIFGFFFKFQETHQFQEVIGGNYVQDDITFTNYGIKFMFEFKSWFYGSPFYQVLQGLLYVFGADELNANIPLLSFVCAYICYMFFIAFCWIIKEFVFLLFNVCNKFIFKED